MNTKKPVALLLEDEPLIAMDLEETLVAGGFLVTAVSSCADAIGWLNMNRPDVVIVDIHLRDGASDNVVEQLTQDGIPFVVHSGGHPSQLVGTPFEHGAWLSKPASADDLVATAVRLARP